MAINLEAVYGRLKPSRVNKVTTEANGTKGKPVQMAEVELEMELGWLEDSPGEMSVTFGQFCEDLFPGSDAMAKHVAADDARGGMDLTARNKLPDITLDVWVSESGREKEDPRQKVAHISAARCKSKPKLKISEEGDAVLCLKLLSRIPMDELATVFEHIGADLWFDAAISQSELLDGDGKVVATIGQVS